MNDVSNPALPGKIADYQPIRDIGGSRLATVYLAQDERVGRTVALKVMAPFLMHEGTFRTRFLRESEAAAAVGHPGIIPVYEAGDTGQNLFIAMRYAQGGDAGSLLRQAGPLHPAVAWNVLAQVAAALDAAHGHGLVHGDVKPSNMLLDSGDGHGPVYLSDFGMGPGLPSGSSPEPPAASYDYTAPEQAAGRPADGRADIYSLACAGYELLCGTPPFGRDQGLTARYAHLYARPPTVTAMRPDLPADVDVALATALAKDPADRYPSCAAFAEAMRAALRLTAGSAASRPAGPGAPARPSGSALAGAAAAASRVPVAPAPRTAGEPERGELPDRSMPVLVGPAVGQRSAGPVGTRPGPGPDGTQSAPGQRPLSADGPQGRPGPLPAQSRAAGGPPYGPGGPYPGPDDPFPGDDERYPGPGQPYAAPGGLYIGPAGPPPEPTQRLPASGAPPGNVPGQYEPGQYEPGQYDRTAEWPPEPGPPYARPEEPFPEQAGWYREPGPSSQAQAGWYREPGEPYADEQYFRPAGGPPRPGRRRGGKRLVLAVTGITVVVAGILVGVLFSRGTSGNSASASRPSHSASPSASTSPATASRQAAAVNNLLSASSAARKSLPGAVSEVLQCTNVSGGISQLQNVVSQRNSEVSQASALSTSALANGATVKSDLVAALRASLTSDQDYLSWAQQQSSGCKPGAQDGAYQAALGADSQSEAAKQTFASVWNPVASTYGLPQQSASTF
jgi:hypothetical protein